MAATAQLVKKAAELLKRDAVIITAAEIDASGVMQRVQLYFWSENQAVMDIVTKDDLVQNWPDTGVYSFLPQASGGNGAFREVKMFEGAEDMYFRIDGTTREADDFGPLPGVVFMEAVEAISQLRERSGGGK